MCNREALEEFGTWLGRKFLVRGNHDVQNEKHYREIFEKVWGIHKMNGIFFTHCPIHPCEMYRCPNIHGHVHNNKVRDAQGDIDKRYRAVCVEQNHGYPERFDEVVEEVHINNYEAGYE